MNASSRVNHDEYQSMLATIFKLSSFELKPLAERIEDLARVTAFEESEGEHV